MSFVYTGPFTELLTEPLSNEQEYLLKDYEVWGKNPVDKMIKDELKKCVTKED